MPLKPVKRCVLILALGLAGCAGVTPSHGPLVADLPLHTEAEGQAGIMAPRQAPRWSRLEIDPILWQADGSLSPAQRAELDRHLTSALEQALAPNDPAAPALRIRAAITGVKTSSPPLNVLTALLVFIPLDRGGAALEIVALDSQTGTPLAAASLAENGGLGEFRGYFNRLGHAKLALERMTLQFRDIMEQPHAQHSTSL